MIKIHLFLILGIFTTAKGFSGNDTTEIIFYSNGASFAPVIVLQDTAEILWTWADSTTSNSTTPVKTYGSSQLRENRLLVTPWSALRRINIGYDAEDGGSTDIEFVTRQYVSEIKNLHLVAPYLREWCSSYNPLTLLDFSSFTNLELIECYLTTQLDSINLTNTPKLRRICFEDNNLKSLDVSDCTALEDLRGAVNNFPTIKFSNSTDELWHICVRVNPQITDRRLFTDMTAFPNIAELFIWEANQEGSLIIHSTSLTMPAAILAANNNYTSADFSGSLQRTDTYSTIDLSFNQLENINLAGCAQVLIVNLSHNNLNSPDIDLVLQQLDANGQTGGNVDLTFNQPPTETGLFYKARLEGKGWVVNVDASLPLSKPESKFNNIKLYPNPVKERLTLNLDNLTNQRTDISIHNITGKIIYSSSYEAGCNQKLDIDMTKFPLGLYILRITSSGNDNVYKVFSKI